MAVLLYSSGSTTVLQRCTHADLLLYRQQNIVNTNTVGGVLFTGCVSVRVGD